MNQNDEYKCSLRIENPLGFHVRPVQRFAELAQLFKAEIVVEIDGREASGKSVMGLMSLGGRHGSTMNIRTSGEDARQALEVIRYLVEEDFFVEDSFRPGDRPRRHIERAQKLASCFDSNVKLILEGKEVDLKSEGELKDVDFSPKADVGFDATGPDADQALQVLGKLVNYRFYVEEAMDAT